jgi:hypothetical protein
MLTLHSSRKPLVSACGFHADSGTLTVLPAVAKAAGPVPSPRMGGASGHTAGGQDLPHSRFQAPLKFRS